MVIQSLRKRNRIITFSSIGIIFLVFMASTLVEFSFTKGFASIPQAIMWLCNEFLPSAESLKKLGDIIPKLTETILLSIAATTVAAVFALIFGVVGSKVTRGNGLLVSFSRGVASISRNIPDAVWAMIFLLSFGQNILTGYFALFFVSFGVLTRAFIETIDEISDNAVEALEASGASIYHIVFQGIIPSSITQMISWILYMIETNIRSSTLIGMLTGTGIGFIFDLYYKSMNYSVASLIVLCIICAVLLIEFTSNVIRRVIM